MLCVIKAGSTWELTPTKCLPVLVLAKKDLNSTVTYFQEKVFAFILSGTVCFLTSDAI